MGSSKKHKKHKSGRREKYEEYSNNMDPAQLQRGLKLILKVGSNSTPEYGSGDSPAPSMTMSYATTIGGPPTAAEAMMATPNNDLLHTEDCNDAEYNGERHKKSKKKKKKKDREKKHKHHKEKRRSDRHEVHHHQNELAAEISSQMKQRLREPSSPAGFLPSPKGCITETALSALAPDGDSSHDAFSFIDENSQPLPQNVLHYAGITTDSSPSCRPVSKPIMLRKPVDFLFGSSPVSLSQQSAPGIPSTSPTKVLPDLLIPPMSPSTPGGSSSFRTAFTSKPLDGPKTPGSSCDSGREPRTCVLKLKQQKSPLNKLLDHLLRFLEKRDPHQFFAWPVTDDIAPGYSSIISKPMDFSTMRQKIDDNEYSTLTEFTDDFKLMCDNAIRYNHVDTVYNKAAKRLLQIGCKYLMPENLIRSLKPLSGYMRDLTAKELGFELLQGVDFSYDHGMTDSADEDASTGADELTQAQLEEEEKRRILRLENAPKTRYEPFVDDLTSEEILAQVQSAALSAKKRLTHKERAQKMGFLRQNSDGTTSLNLLIKDDNEGPEKVVSIGDLVGKLSSGTGQLQGLREDKRNEAKLVKTLNYGAFATFAPAFDSRFSNLSMEETQLVMRTYDDSSSAEYAESILQFTKNSNYATMLANGLLDVLTNGEHSKAMSDLYDMQCQNHEQAEVAKCFYHDTSTVAPVASADDSVESREEIEQEYEKYKNTRIDFNRLRSLNDIGINVDFLDDMEAEMKNFELTRRLQEHLSNNLNLIEKLRATQNERLSQTLPLHLAQVPQPGKDETHLANQITQQLSDLAKKLPPAAVADSYSVRRAMGMSYIGLPPPVQQPQQIATPELLQQPVAMPHLQLSGTSQQHSRSATGISIPSNSNANQHVSNTSSVAMDIDDDIVGTSSGVDLENELREFLESGPGLAATSNADDSNIVAQLLMN